MSACASMSTWRVQFVEQRTQHFMMIFLSWVHMNEMVCWYFFFKVLCCLLVGFINCRVIQKIIHRKFCTGAAEPPQFSLLGLKRELQLLKSSYTEHGRGSRVSLAGSPGRRQRLVARCPLLAKSQARPSWMVEPQVTPGGFPKGLDQDRSWDSCVLPPGLRWS